MKRKRGGQPGNQNARKHGLYCGALTPGEICEFWNLLNTEDIEPEVAVLRVKVISSLKRDPGNPRLLRDASKLLARWYGAKLGLNRTDINRFRKAILSFIEAGRLVLPALSEVEGSEAEGSAPVLMERIEPALTT